MRIASAARRPAASTSTSAPRSCGSAASPTGRSGRMPAAASTAAATGGARLRRDGGQRVQRGPHVHRAATLAARRGRTYGLRVMIGLPWEQHVAFLDDRRGRGSIERRVGDGVRAAPGTRPSSATRSGTRSRPRSSAGTAGAASSGSSSVCATPSRTRIPTRSRHLRELPDHRVPRAALPRLRVLQRVPRVAGAPRGLSGAPAEPRGRPPAGHGRDRARQPPARRGRAGARARLAGADDVRGRVRRSVRVRAGPTSGTAAVSTSRTGTSA